MSSAPSALAPAVVVPPAAEATLASRVAAIDRLRGLVIVLMALDHARDFFTDVRYSPTDVDQTTLALFATRWVTHLCAPIFVFLAGLSVALRARRDPPAQLSKFLVTRGLWMIVLELTVVRLGWSFSLDYSQGFFLQVIWAIGVSMIALAALVRLPRRAVLAIAIVILAGHNALDGIRAETFGSAAWVWRLVHEQGMFALGFIAYPVLPWIGVMALGYGAGTLYELDDGARRRVLLLAGGGALVAFAVLRATNLYGDPTPWTWHAEPVRTAMSFMNVAKYPPSLLYVLATLGIGGWLLAALESANGRFGALLAVYGRVPLFAYVAHIFLLHLFAGLVGLAAGFGTSVLFAFVFMPANGWGYGLPVVYGAWLVTMALLYPMCVAYGAVKRRGRAWWWSYL